MRKHDWLKRIQIWLPLIVASLYIFKACSLPNTATPPSPSKQVVANTLPLQELWRWSGEVSYGNNDPPELIIQKNLVLLAITAREPTRYRAKLIALDAQTGKLIWETEPTFEWPDSLYADGERVYVSYSRYVQAFDLATGQELWRGVEQSTYKKGGLHVYATEAQVEVYDIDTARYPLNSRQFILDAKTGATIGVNEWSGLFFQQNNIYYVSSLIAGSFGKGMIAKDKESSDTLWRLDTTGLVRRWPIVVDNRMYLDAGDIYALNPDTGEVYWLFEDQAVIVPKTDYVDKRYENKLIAKIAYGGDTLYFIRSDGAVVGLNPRTGEPTGIIELEPQPNYYDSDGDFTDTAYLIAASDEFVTVYYNDSQELIAFKRQDVVP